MLLSAAVYLYFTDGGLLDFTVMPRFDIGSVFLGIVWAVLVAGMLFRLIPNKHTAMGARKHFECSFDATPDGVMSEAEMAAAGKRLHKGAFLSALGWVALNAGIFFMLSAYDILSPAMVILIVLVYALSDMVCVLFFCPFQLFFMRNRCCVTCRIYNWDYAMMCTPFILIPSAYSLSLLLLSVAVLLRWETALLKNPRFFMEETNENLSCNRCEERLCRSHDRTHAGRSKI